MSGCGFVDIVWLCVRVAISRALRPVIRQRPSSSRAREVGEEGWPESFGSEGGERCGWVWMCGERGWAGLGSPARSGRPLRLELELKFGCLGGPSAVAAVRARRRRLLSAGHRRRRRLSAPRLDDGASGGRTAALARGGALAARGGRGLAATGLGLDLGGGGFQVREKGVWGREGARVSYELRDAAAGVAVGGGGH